MHGLSQCKYSIECRKLTSAFVRHLCGICKEVSSRFTNGIEIISATGSSDIDLAGRTYQRMNAGGGFVGAGAQLKVMGKLGLKVEGGYIKTEHGAISDARIIYRFNYVNFLGGLTFSL